MESTVVVHSFPSYIHVATHPHTMNEPYLAHAVAGTIRSCKVLTTSKNVCYDVKTMCENPTLRTDKLGFGAHRHLSLPSSDAVGIYATRPCLPRFEKFVVSVV